MFRGNDHIGIDLDSHDGFGLLKSFFNLCWTYRVPAEKVEIYKTNHGFHLILRGVESNVDVRRNLGDDPRRCHMSEDRMRTSGSNWDDALFVSKELYGISTTRKKICLTSGTGLL